jgi:hypothetical protein
MNNLTISDEAPTVSEVEVSLDAMDLAITPEVMAFYAKRAADAKEEIDKLAAETSQRQDKMRFLNDLIAEINSLTDEKQCLDISKHLELQEKLRIAQELGVKITGGKLKFDSIERSRLVENLHLQGDNWDKENKTQTQKMDIYIKELDRVMMLLKEVQKYENQSKRGALSGIKGS